MSYSMKGAQLHTTNALSSNLMAQIQGAQTWVLTHKLQSQGAYP